MRLRFCYFFPLLISASLIGCATRFHQPPVTTTPEVSKPEMPFQEPAARVTELDSDIVYHALAGEIALQRGQLDAAYKHQNRTAELAEDAVASERAARVALLLKRDDLALEAVRRWVRLAPNDLDARQLAVLLHFRVGQEDLALQQMEAIVAISERLEVDGYISSMVILSKEADRGRVRRLMNRFVERHSEDPRAGYALALLSLAWRDFSQAEADIGDVLSRNPDWNKGYVLLSRIRKMQGDNEGALKILKEAVQRDANDLEANTALAKLLVETDDFEGGYRQFRKVQRLSPDDDNTTYALGVLALQLEKPRAAKKYFRALYDSGKRKDDAAYYLGRIEEQSKNWEQAIQWYEKVTRGDYHFDAQVRIAQVMAGEGRVQEARHWVQNLRVQMKEYSVQLYLLEVDILKNHASAREVLALYGKALEAHPESDDLLYARGLYAAEIDRMDILERDLRRVIARDPENADALNALGYTYADRSIRFDEALRLISQALKLNPDSPAILDSMGWLQYRLGNYEQALDYLRRAFDLLPDSEIAAHLGEVLWVTGDQKEALRIWQHILSQDPENRHVRKTMERLGV